MFDNKCFTLIAFCSIKMQDETCYVSVCSKAVELRCSKAANSGFPIHLSGDYTDALVKRLSAADVMLRFSSVGNSLTHLQLSCVADVSCHSVMRILSP